MTIAVTLSKPELDTHDVLQAIRSATCKIDYRVRSGVFGETLEHSIQGLAHRMKATAEKVQGLVFRLMSAGLVRYAKNRLTACHKNGHHGAYCRTSAIRGKSLRAKVMSENLSRESEVVDPAWDPEKLTKEEKKYRRWAWASIKSAKRPISPAGGWDYVTAPDTDKITMLIRKRDKKIRKHEQKIREKARLQELQDLVDEPFDEDLPKEEAVPCGLASELQELVYA